MQAHKLLQFESDDALAHAAAMAWLDLIEQKNRRGEVHTVALSGGRIAKKLFTSVVELAVARRIDFNLVHFFWADERCVPPENPESNFRLAREFLLEPLHIPSGKIHRIRGEIPPRDSHIEPPNDSFPGLQPPSPHQRMERRGQGEERLGVHGEETMNFAVQEAEAELCRIAPLNADGMPVLDLVILGMGEDGHIASLFPNSPQNVLGSPLPFLAITDSPKPPPRRITLTYKALALAREVWVLASGKGKEAALAESLFPGGTTPLARLIASRGETIILSDIRLGQKAAQVALGR